jgi:DNA-binding MarR family transcriptional regulator
MTLVTIKKPTRSDRPPHTLEEDVFISLQRTADGLMQGIEELLRPTGLSVTQYNVLRILRGAAPEGLACGEIAQRMITRDPDITRLLDRLEARGWVTRSREKRDRRIITTRITSAGLRLLKTLDRPVRELHRRRMRHVNEKKLNVLLRLLESVRENG